MDVSQPSAGFTEQELETIFGKETNTMEPVPRTSSEEETPVTILNKDENSEFTVDKPSTDSLTSGRVSTAWAEDDDKQLRLFVTLLTTRLLKKCHALEKRKQEEWVAHIKSVVDQTMEGLSVTGDYSPDRKTIKKVCKSVLKDLKEKLCGQLETVILLQDPAVDAAIVQSLQAHIKNLPSRLAKKAASRKWWREFLEGVAFAVGVLATLIIMVVIP